MAIDPKQKEIISIFYHMVNKDYSQVNTIFVIENLDQVLKNAHELGIKSSELIKYLKKDQNIQQKIETYISNIEIEEFLSKEGFFNKILDKNSSVLIEKNLYVNFSKAAYGIMSHVGFMSNPYGKDFTSLLSLLDQIDVEKVNKDLMRLFVEDMFGESSFRKEPKPNNLFSTMMPVYEHPKFVEMTAMVLKENKDIAQGIKQIVSHTINNITEQTLKNIYPKGEFGRIKPNQQIQLLDSAQKIMNIHNISISKNGIKAAKSFKNICDDYSKLANTEKVSDVKYQKVQSNLDSFMDSLIKKKNKVKP